MCAETQSQPWDQCRWCWCQNGSWRQVTLVPHPPALGSGVCCSPQVLCSLGFLSHRWTAADARAVSSGRRLEGVFLTCHWVGSAGELLSESLCTFLKEKLVSKDNYCLLYSVFRCVCAGWGKMVEKNDSRGFLNKTSDWEIVSVKCDGIQTLI